MCRCRMALSRQNALFLKEKYPFFRQVINPLSMLNNSSGQRLFSEDTLNKLNVAFVIKYGQMQEGEFTDELKRTLIDALEGLARGDQTAAQKAAFETHDLRLFAFLNDAKTILMPAKGGRRLRKCKTRGLAKRKTRGLAKCKTRGLAKKTRRS